MSTSWESCRFLWYLVDLVERPELPDETDLQVRAFSQLDELVEDGLEVINVENICDDAAKVEV